MGVGSCQKGYQSEKLFTKLGTSYNCNAQQGTFENGIKVYLSLS